MTIATLPDGPEALTPQVLSALLGADVADADILRIGEDEGFTGGGLYRIALRYRSGGGPASVVAKLGPTAPDLRRAMAASNRREVDCYALLAGFPDLPAAQCLFGRFDPETGASLAIVEDLGNRRPVRFITGCDTHEATAAVDAMARIHARFWNAPELARLNGAAILDEFGFAENWAAYPAAVAKLLPHVTLPGWFTALGDFIARHDRAIFGYLMERAPLTFAHRDLHVDNLLFAGQGPDQTAILLDWQISGRAKGVLDLSYFLISSLQPATRRAVEPGLLRRYHAALMAQGVTGYGFDACQRDYLGAVVGKFHLSVIATVMLENSSPHKRAWRAADLERLMAFCLDHRITGETLRFMTAQDLP